MESKPKCKLLWHGTKDLAPAEVYKNDGLNINYSKDGYWGKGIYFAVNANYSCPDYSHSVGTNIYEVFVANVVIGNEKDFGITK